MGKRFVIGLLALCLFSFCVQLALYPSLPETVPIHWNAAGEVDGWAGKPAVLLLGLLPFGLTVLFAALPKIDPKKESYRKHMKVYRPLSALFVLFFIGMVWLVMLSALEFKLPVGGLISAGIGLYAPHPPQLHLRHPPALDAGKRDRLVQDPPGRRGPADGGGNSDGRVGLSAGHRRLCRDCGAAGGGHRLFGLCVGHL